MSNFRGKPKKKIIFYVHGWWLLDVIVSPPLTPSLLPSTAPGLLAAQWRWGRVGAKGVQGDRSPMDSPCPTPPARRHSVIRPVGGGLVPRNALPAPSPTCLFPCSATTPTQRRLGGDFGGRTAREGQAGGGGESEGLWCSPPPPPPVIVMAYQNAYRNGHAEGDPGGLLLTFRPCRPHPLRPNPTLRHKKDRVRERECWECMLRRTDAMQRARERKKREDVPKCWGGSEGGEARPPECELITFSGDPGEIKHHLPHLLGHAGPRGWGGWCHKILDDDRWSMMSPPKNPSMPKIQTRRWISKRECNSKSHFRETLADKKSISNPKWHFTEKLMHFANKFWARKGPLGGGGAPLRSSNEVCSAKKKNTMVLTKVGKPPKPPTPKISEFLIRKMIFFSDIFGVPLTLHPPPSFSQ